MDVEAVVRKRPAVAYHDLTGAVVPGLNGITAIRIEYQSPVVLVVRRSMYRRSFLPQLRGLEWATALVSSA
jgi:hypothetical protein